MNIASVNGGSHIYNPNTEIMKLSTPIRRKMKMIQNQKSVPKNLLSSFIHYKKNWYCVLTRERSFNQLNAY